VGESTKNEFNHFLSKYAQFKQLSIKNENDTTCLSSQIKKNDLVVISLFADSNSWIKNISSWINQLAHTHPLIVCSFTDPAVLSEFENNRALLAAYTDDNEIQKAAAQIIFGGLEAKGKLAVNINDTLPAGTSIKTSFHNRFSYTLPEAAGMDSRTLEKIEAIAQEAIDIKGTPGCHVLIAKDGKVIFERSFGYQTYEKKIPVTDETIYDLASVTKVSATLQAVMYMQEKGLIDINKKASVYLPELNKSNKEDYVIKDILTHQAGLWPYLPFWSETVKDSSSFRKYYSRSANARYYFPVAEGMFAHKSMKDSLWQWIIKAKVRDKSSHAIFDYRYSDMGFYIMQHLAEKMLRQPQEEFLQSTIYKPLGAYTTGYLPLRKFPYAQVAPTEKDTLFRKSLLIGYVHDQGAAMHGGIAGHAGLFSNANDLAKLGQMWLNKGSYGGIQFFKPETLDLFTAKQYEDSRRGLGWDKPTPSDWNGPTSLYASAKTFGHTGFTGTCIWIDPEFNLVYVFLSNRVHPDMNNTKILNANIRPRIQEVIYQSIFEYCKNHPTVETKNE
jgi:CubicO group peptidase (beta-lactamase class C family)